jgi:hypothetical protein
MKAFYCAIAALVTLASLPTFQASARPAESDRFCYMRTPAGRVIDLTAQMYGVGQLNPISRNAFLTTGSATADNSSYDPRYRSVRTETRGGVTRTISGGSGDDFSEARDRTVVVNPSIGSYGSTYRSHS